MYRRDGKFEKYTRCIHEDINSSHSSFPPSKIQIIIVGTPNEHNSHHLLNLTFYFERQGLHNKSLLKHLYTGSIAEWKRQKNF